MNSVIKCDNNITIANYNLIAFFTYIFSDLASSIESVVFKGYMKPPFGKSEMIEINKIFILMC